MKITNSKLTDSTKWILENMDSATNENVTCEGEIMNVGYSTAKLKFYSDGWGDFYLFGGYCLDFALIQASSFDSAYGIYLEEFVPCDEMETEEDVEYGTFDGSGGFYSECTTSSVVALNPDEYTFDFDIVSN